MPHSLSNPSIRLPSPPRLCPNKYNEIIFARPSTLTIRFICDCVHRQLPSSSSTCRVVIVVVVLIIFDQLDETIARKTVSKIAHFIVISLAVVLSSRSLRRRPVVALVSYYHPKPHRRLPAPSSVNTCASRNSQRQSYSLLSLLSAESIDVLCCWIKYTGNSSRKIQFNVSPPLGLVVWATLANHLSVRPPVPENNRNLSIEKLCRDVQVFFVVRSARRWKALQRKSRSAQCVLFGRPKCVFSSATPQRGRGARDRETCKNITRANEKSKKVSLTLSCSNIKLIDSSTNVVVASECEILLGQ